MAAPLHLANFLTAIEAVGYEWDARADRIQWFGACPALFGSSPPPDNIQDLHAFLHPEDRLAFLADSTSTLLDRHYRLVHADGKSVEVHERGAIEQRDGRLLYQRGILRTSLPTLHPRTTTQPNRDALTGCYDRGHMLVELGTAMEATQKSRRYAGYLTIGIDKMSFVNEAVGMEAGDTLLRGVVDRLRQLIPSHALLARVGGDMFGILLPDTLGDDMHPLADHILRSFRDQPVITSVVPLHITVSIGGVLLPAMARNATEGMIFAEQALHSARQRGRNMFVEYVDAPERTEEHRQLLALSERIKHAFKHAGFQLAYQPVVDARSGAVLFYEALVRMFDPDGKPVSAALFVPVIEQMGLAFELDCMVLDLAIAALETKPDLHLAVNVSGITATHADWPAHVQTVLGHRQDIAKRIIIEITETAAIVDVAETRKFIDSIRALGMLVSLDDFGAGFTSIRHLRSLGLSIMKIDKELLQNLLTNAEQQHLVLVLIELAHGLMLKVVAEGVESADIADWLRRAKVDMLQGYYFGKPLLNPDWLTHKGTPIDQPATKSPATATG